MRVVDIPADHSAGLIQLFGQQHIVIATVDVAIAYGISRRTCRCEALLSIVHVIDASAIGQIDTARLHVGGVIDRGFTALPINQFDRLAGRIINDGDQQFAKTFNSDKTPLAIEDVGQRSDTQLPASEGAVRLCNLRKVIMP
ncbi:hypothetical protein Xcaj_11640 [Xanthomonas axonopodis pv. cajani]|uniref:Uncharacterized protein n=1 Tax=Xanthomonas axonopodis pv. cajani TaxID=487827 RepID=A0ABX3M9U2_9XANT|nr:hypothetical protein Xcaj_11640 [Xanthomonas axonopodis pv. cajani]